MLILLLASRKFCNVIPGQITEEIAWKLATFLYNVLNITLHNLKRFGRYYASYFTQSVASMILVADILLSIRHSFLRRLTTQKPFIKNCTYWHLPHATSTSSVLSMVIIFSFSIVRLFIFFLYPKHIHWPIGQYY